jgi:hypothetical protein
LTSSDVVEIARRQRHLYLLRKVKQGKLLSVKEIGELAYYERQQAENRKKQRR